MTHRYDFEEVWGLDAGIVTLGQEKMRALMARALSLIPSEVADSIVESLLFATTESTGEAYYLPADLIGGKGIVVLDRGLFDESPESQVRTFLHESAHSLLGHSSLMIHAVSKSDYERQESEAWARVESLIGPPED